MDKMGDYFIRLSTMITKEKIEAYIEKVPAMPEVVKKCSSALEGGDLVKAASFAGEDPAFMFYLRNIVNKPIFGFREDIKDPKQIFGILGLSRASQVVKSYLVSLMTPKDWVVFKLNGTLFQNLQSSLIVKWEKILEHEDCKDKDIISTISILPSSIIICEELFRDFYDDFLILSERNDLSFNDVLKNLTGMSILGIAKILCEKWSLPDTVANILEILETKESPNDDENMLKIAKYMHLLLFYELSRADFIDTGLNSFIEFDVEFAQDVYDDFLSIEGVE